MTNYRRLYHQGGCDFFTVNLANRNSQLLTEHVELLKKAFRHVKQKHPFCIDALVVLPNHLHCVWTLPEGDSNYSTRWQLIKRYFSYHLPYSSDEIHSNSRARKAERGIWQRRFWEHLIQNEHDYRTHIDYVHINPLKHQYVTRVRDWPYSSFHSCVEKGIYTIDWAGISPK
jgi:putative transposase